MSSHNPDEQKLEVKEDEKHLLLDHNYDSIQELNHPLPRWWNAILYMCIVFAAGYFVYYQLMSGPTLRDEFKVEYGRVLAAKEEFRKLNGTFNEAFYADILKNDGVNKGKDVYELNCMPCHMEGGKGDVGPNLSDNYWLIAKGTPETIFPVVFHGSEENGMPAWGELLPKEEIYQAVSYVMTFHNTFAKGGKEPQGEKVEE